MAMNAWEPQRSSRERRSNLQRWRDRRRPPLPPAFTIKWVPVLAMLALSVGASIVLVVYREPVERIGDWGYAGTFLIMVLNNVTIILPAVGHAFLVAAAQVLNPVLVGIVGGLGATIGEISGYIIGRSGHGAIQRYPLFQKVRERTGRLFGPALFIFALTPLPFDVVGIVAGGMRYPWWRFLVFVGVGKVLNTIIIAVASFYTIDWIGNLFT